MYLVTLDSEQAMILVAALTATNSLMAARLHRVDPEKILSNSVQLQQHKIEQIEEQLKGGQIARWADLDEAQRLTILQMATAFSGAKTALEHEHIYDVLLDAMLSMRTGSMPLLHKGEPPA